MIQFSFPGENEQSDKGGISDLNIYKDEAESSQYATKNDVLKIKEMLQNMGERSVLC